MKHNYDKEIRTHPISIGDTVMIWTPYTKSGLSKCFQPKWTGPWTVYSFTEPSNCKLIDINGNHKNVHINQLKLIETRSKRPTLPKEQVTSNDTIEQLTEMPGVFGHIIDEVSDAPHDNINNHINPVHPHNINEAWVDIDPGNILPHRTRGGIVSVMDVM